MNHGTNQILFALLRSAIRGEALSEEMRAACTPDAIKEMSMLASRQDLVHLLAHALAKEGLLPAEATEKHILRAVYRYEGLQYEYERIIPALEAAKIPFIPLKGSILRAEYPEPWMRTSCDIDLLVRPADLARAGETLVSSLGYTEGERATHDVAYYSPSGRHIELHFDLLEEGRAAAASAVLSRVWEDATPREDGAAFHELSDPFFYFYHIAHMAKHFESGGCGLRPFIDLYLLDRRENADIAARDALLLEGGLLDFAKTAQRLSRVMMEGGEIDPISEKLLAFLLHGGVYGSADNRVALQQRRHGGRIGYLFSRIFAPHAKLKRYYPILEKYPILNPVMQVRRWLMLLSPDVARMAKRELETNGRLDREKAVEMQLLLSEIGL